MLVAPAKIPTKMTVLSFGKGISFGTGGGGGGGLDGSTG